MRLLNEKAILITGALETEGQCDGLCALIELLLKMDRPLQHPLETMVPGMSSLRPHSFHRAANSQS